LITTWNGVLVAILFLSAGGAPLVEPFIAEAPRGAVNARICYTIRAQTRGRNQIECTLLKLKIIATL
jgi:hypothetical protein